MTLPASEPSRHHRTRLPVACALLVCGALSAPQASAEARVLDDFSDTAAWRVVTSNQVTGEIVRVDGVEGPALCLDYDFNGVSGHAGLQRDLPLEAYPDNYQFRFQLRGESPANDLQFKLIDGSGDNVWWVNRPRYDFPQAWTEVRYKRRHIDKAWGPDPDKTLRRSAQVEFTIYNNAGGRGRVCFDQLTLESLPVDDGSPLVPVSSDADAGDPRRAFDGDRDTAWEGRGGERRLRFDLGRVREFGGLRLAWGEEMHASDYTVRLSEDGKVWTEARRVTGGAGDVDWLALPEAEARYIALDLHAGPGAGYALREFAVQPLAFSDHPNEVIKAMAAEAPRGWFPRGFSGEQPNWTIMGIDGGIEQGLIGEDGAIEFYKGGFSLEPVVLVDDAMVTWADVAPVQSLQDGYLPIPSVDWRHDAFALRVTGFAEGDRDASRLVARYRLENTSGQPRAYTLALAVQPWQVNPPGQFLNTIGGVSRIESLAVEDAALSVNGTHRVTFSRAPDQAFASTFDNGLAVPRLASGRVSTTATVDDPERMASGALLYRVELAPGEVYELDLRAPLAGAVETLDDADAATLQARVAADWRDQLDRVRIEVPAAGQPLADTLRTSLAHMLISRIGPRLQPGTRSYSRSWIRDGAMISEGLLRMNRPEVVEEYVTWYAPYQFDNGMVPCCVDDRGSDPVPENDSHGELIFNIVEYWRYTGDDAFLARMWPHIAGAFAYMEELRASERTEENRAINPAFYGMMPASISHEGYSAKPMHSYWDNFWALRGYKDAVEAAQALGRAADVARMTAARDEFREDLDASLRAAAKLHRIDYLPGAAELGDFDPTSTTIALAPGGEQGRLPAELLRNTFEQYWTLFSDRRDGRLEWKDYTPYEWRNVAAFVRLGWRERAWEVVEYFFADRAPEAWNQWAEVVSATPRKPFFVGDLPHAWVGSDYVRSALDMFAYVREIDDSMVLAAGLPVAWFDEGVAIHGLRTPQGTLGYRLRRDGDALLLSIDADAGLPDGGLVLPWPYAGTPGETTVNGEPAEWERNELRVREAGAEVRIALPTAG
ncbi:discoidin domain-containing protein [Luteimonas abyssi]|uniref:discoidin domain-containing protein n=1 Tax=Luteimonas abyssi TaxID=1247514 RepID=UPI0009EBA970|nr:discoidin domain-containing protein [Luteimonas abyssi]